MCSQGVIPPDWGQPGAFPSLQHLNLGGNQLKGELPEIGLGALSKLEVCAYALHRAKQVDVVQFRIVAQYHAHHNSTGRAAKIHDVPCRHGDCSGTCFMGVSQSPGGT